jgi:hypothetical protein
LNLTQLEQIKQKINEIQAIINKDRSGCLWIDESFAKFIKSVNDQIDFEVVAAYKKGELRKAE